MQVAEVEEGETVEGGGQVGDDDFVVADLDGGRVAHSPTVQSQATQGQADQGVDRVPVFDVKNGAPAPKDLGGVVGFNAQSLLQVNPANPLFQPLEFDRFPVHDDSGRVAVRPPVWKKDDHREREVLA
jgi:hypothetical protein